MIKDLVKIQQLGNLNKDENFRFRSYLKMQDPYKIDKIVNRLYRKYFSAIDCTTCGCNPILWKIYAAHFK